VSRAKENIERRAQQEVISHGDRTRLTLMTLGFVRVLNWTYILS
jgi:hypothetical protein